jgi:hypothetical protein
MEYIVNGYFRTGFAKKGFIISAVYDERDLSSDLPGYCYNFDFHGFPESLERMRKHPLSFPSSSSCMCIRELEEGNESGCFCNCNYSIKT